MSELENKNDELSLKLKDVLRDIAFVTPLLRKLEVTNNAGMSLILWMLFHGLFPFHSCVTSEFISVCLIKCFRTVICLCRK